MANELKHGSVGTELTQTEWEAVGTHVIANQAVGDIIYASTTAQLRRLGVGSNTNVLTLAAGIPSWAAPAAAAAGSLTGSTLASGVTASSLTSVGTLTALTGGTGDLNWDSGTLFVDSSANRIGINRTTDLLSTLDVIRTGTSNQTAISPGNLQAAATGVGVSIHYVGNTAGQSMVDLQGVWEDGTSTSFKIETRNAGTMQQNFVIKGDGEVDFKSRAPGITNIGAAGNDWTANRLNITGSNNGGDQLLHIENTSDTAGSDSQIDLHVGGTSAGDPNIKYSVEGIAGGNAVMGVDTSSSATVPQFAIGRSSTVGGNDALRISYATPPIVSYNTSHPTGTFDYVCESCGRHQAATFACCGTVGWHDDVLDYRAMALRESGALDYMERVGVIERGVNNDGDPEIFTLLGRDFEFAMSAAWQNRQRMDTQHDELDRRLTAIGG